MTSWKSREAAHMKASRLNELLTHRQRWTAEVLEESAEHVECSSEQVKKNYHFRTPRCEFAAAAARMANRSPRARAPANPDLQGSTFGSHRHSAFFHQGLGRQTISARKPYL